MQLSETLMNVDGVLTHLATLKQYVIACSDLDREIQLQIYKDCVDIEMKLIGSKLPRPEIETNNLRRR